MARNKKKRYSYRKKRTVKKVTHRRVYTRPSLHISQSYKPTVKKQTVRKKIKVLKNTKAKQNTKAIIKKTHSLLPTQNNPLLKAYTCARRKIRKEIIFALNKNGRGNARPKYNTNSKIKC